MRFECQECMLLYNAEQKGQQYRQAHFTANRLLPQQKHLNSWPRWTGVSLVLAIIVMLQSFK